MTTTTRLMRNVKGIRKVSVSCVPVFKVDVDQEVGNEAEKMEIEFHE